MRNVRILKIITILSANFIQAAKTEEDIFYICCIFQKLLVSLHPINIKGME